MHRRGHEDSFPGVVLALVGPRLQTSPPGPPSSPRPRPASREPLADSGKPRQQRQGACAKHTEAQRPGTGGLFAAGVCSPQLLVKAGGKQGLSGGRSSQLTWAMGDATPAREVRDWGGQAAVIRAASDSGIPRNGGKETGGHRICTSTEVGGAEGEKPGGHSPQRGVRQRFDEREGLRSETREPDPHPAVSLFQTQGGVEEGGGRSKRGSPPSCRIDYARLSWCRVGVVRPRTCTHTP